jgi:hypothetical protein
MHQDRDTEPGMLDSPMLGCIDVIRRFARIAAVRTGGRAGGAAG